MPLKTHWMLSRLKVAALFSCSRPYPTTDLSVVLTFNIANLSALPKS